MIEQEKARDCIKALLEVESGLTNWEIEFIDFMDKRESLTQRQINKIIEIYDKICL